MFATGIIVLVGFLWLAKQFFGAAVRKEVFVGFFMVSTFTCAIDIFLATEIHGDGKGIMGWYLERGERYFQSAYGFAINAWDGSSHYMMYIAMIYALSSHRPEAFRPLYFTWLGSIFYSLIIFLPGAVVGPYSNELCLSTLLNVPYILVPVIFFFKLQAQYRPAVKALHSAHTFSARLLVDTAFIFLLVAAAVIAFLRFAVSLDSKLPLADMWARYEPTLHDENKFFHIYGIVSMYYFIPLYCAFAYLLAFGTTVGSTAQVSCWFWPPQSGRDTAFGQRNTPIITLLSDPFFAQFVTELAWVHAGGSLQAQFAYTVSAFHWRTSSQRQVAEDSQSLFLLMNGLLFIVPAMFATYVHCCGFPSQPLWHF